MSGRNVNVATDNELQMLTVEQVAEFLQCSERDVRRKSANGTIPRPTKIGRHARWPRKVIQKWIEDGCPRVDDSLN